MKRHRSQILNRLHIGTHRYSRFLALLAGLLFCNSCFIKPSKLYADQPFTEAQENTPNAFSKRSKTPAFYSRFLALKQYKGQALLLAGPIMAGVLYMCWRCYKNRLTPYDEICMALNSDMENGDRKCPETIQKLKIYKTRFQNKELDIYKTHIINHVNASFLWHAILFDSPVLTQQLFEIGFDLPPEQNFIGLVQQRHMDTTTEEKKKYRSPISDKFYKRQEVYRIILGNYKKQHPDAERPDFVKLLDWDFACDFSKDKKLGVPQNYHKPLPSPKRGNLEDLHEGESDVVKAVGKAIKELITDDCFKEWEDFLCAFYYEYLPSSDNDIQDFSSYCSEFDVVFGGKDPEEDNYIKYVYKTDRFDRLLAHYNLRKTILSEKDKKIPCFPVREWVLLADKEIEKNDVKDLKAPPMKKIFKESASLRLEMWNWYCFYLKPSLKNKTMKNPYFCLDDDYGGEEEQNKCTIDEELFKQDFFKTHAEEAHRKFFNIVHLLIVDAYIPPNVRLDFKKEVFKQTKNIRQKSRIDSSIKKPNGYFVRRLDRNGNTYESFVWFDIRVFMVL